MNPILESLYKHKSIRKYKNVPLEEEKLQYIIKAAQAAPTWCNGQHVSIIVIKDKARKELLQKLCFDQKYISECSVFLIFCADFYRTSLAFEKAGKTKEEFTQYMTNIEPLIIGSHDVGIAIQNAVVAAESLGLGTVDVGGVRLNIKDVDKELNLPKYVIPLIGLCVGYPDDEPQLKPRLPMKGICFEDKYDVQKAKEGIDEYDEIYKKYLTERGSNTRDSNWSTSISTIYTFKEANPIGEYDLLLEKGFTIDKK